MYESLIGREPPKGPSPLKMRNNTFHQKCRSLVDAGGIDVVLFQIALLDLSVCKHNSREDQQRQVEVSEDCVTGGYKLNDTDLGSCCACEQKYDYEKTVLKRSFLCGLTIELGVSCYCTKLNPTAVERTTMKTVITYTSFRPENPSAVSVP